MSHMHVDVTSDRRHYRIEVHVDGDVEPTTVFGCHEALSKILLSLDPGHREQHTPGPAPEAGVGRGVTSITFHLPSGRILAFSRVAAYQGVAKTPEGPG